MIRRRLILYVNEYGSGEVPDFHCKAEMLEDAKYRIKEVDENALNLLAIGELIGAGAKASFGIGLFKIVCC